MNILDLITIGIIVVCVVVCYAKGLVISVFNFLSFFITFILTSKIYPVFSEFLKTTSLHDSIKQSVAGWIGQSVVLPDAGAVVGDAINSLAVPVFFKGMLLSNVSGISFPDASGVFDYAAGFAADLAIDGISIALVFLGVFILMRLAAAVLKLVTKLPVIKTLNRIGGGVIGLLIGAVLSWLVISVLSGLFAANTDFPVSDLLAASVFAKYFAGSILSVP